MNEYPVYEKEINLKELFFYCLKNWRWIALSMVIVALLAGGYKYQVMVKSNQNKQVEAELTKDDREEQTVSIIENPNISYYELAIQKEEQNVEQLQDFVEHSVIMELDAEHLQTATVSFYLQVPEGEKEGMEALVASFRTYVTDGRLAKKLQQADDSISMSDIQYLLEFSDSKDIRTFSRFLDSKDMQIFYEDSVVLSSEWSEKQVFQIQATAPTSELCEMYMSIIQEAIVSYSASLQEEVEAHELRVVATSLSECADTDLRTYQSEMRTAYIDAVRNLRELRAELETVRKDEGETIAVVDKAVFEKPMKAAVKFAIIGLVMGAFLAVFVLVLIFIMSGKLLSLDNFEREYGMKLLGIVGEKPTKKMFGFIDRWLNRMAEGAYAELPYEERVKIAVSNVKAEMGKHEDLKKVMVAGTIAEKATQEFCYQMRAELDTILFSEYKQIVFSAAALEEMGDYEAVLFVEKRGKSDGNLICQEEIMAVKRNALVLGVVVV